MDYNYHTHTHLCSHAKGTMEEYVKQAIEGGIKFMGFSDHAPFINETGNETYYRVPFSELDGYFKEAYRLQEKYKDKIDIKVGFEMEYYPDDFDKMLKSAKEWGADYLILGEHFLEDESKAAAVTKATDDEEFLKRYVNNIIEAIKSSVFTYVAHPDMIRFLGSGEIYDREMIKICKASEKYNVPLEINFLGMRAKRHYPNEHFWALAGKTKCPVTFGFDAHDPEGACDKESLPKALELVEKYNLNYIGRPEIVPPANIEQR